MDTICHKKITNMIFLTYENSLENLLETHFQIDFIDFSEPWLGNETKLILTCSMHGQWNTTTIASLLAQKVGCPICSNIAVGNRFRLPDEELIKDIRNSGVFSEYDLFVRSEKFHFINWFLNNSIFHLSTIY